MSTQPGSDLLGVQSGTVVDTGTPLKQDGLADARAELNTSLGDDGNIGELHGFAFNCCLIR